MPDDRRCGTCHWWTQWGVNGRGTCNWRRPESVKLPKAFIVRRAVMGPYDGTDCPTWKMKEKNDG